MAPNDSEPHGRILLRDATAADAGPLTRLFLASRAESMPYLPKVHSDEDTLAWMTHVVLPGTTVRIAETGTGELLGFASLDGSELEHLYLRPDVRRRGIGSLLLAEMRGLAAEELTLYVFQRNTDARAFYERHGFTAVEFDDGSRNEEKEPDVRYRWTAVSTPRERKAHVAAGPAPQVASDWWRDAVIYQIYVRSFADGDGDGTGDLAGVRARLPYLVELGVDAIWFTPWYLSPLADGGYDVADYRTIDPAFGSLAEAEGLIADARELGIRVIVDIVPNHVSDQHAWFRAALAAGPGSPERELFHFRTGRGTDGELPPNDWVSEFGGVPWTRLADGDWYLHLFATQQPDLNWAHPAVRQEHEDVLRFWLDRGVSGVRIDSAALLAKDPALPDFVEGRDPHPFSDRDELHDIYRSWRAIADEYGAIFVGEVWLPDSERFARYLRPDELHTAFNLNFLACPWDAGRLRSTIDDTLAEHAAVGAPATWVLCNHDVTRTVTRYGREDTGFAFGAKTFGTPTDLALGSRRARAAALLSLALPGAVYLYQGEELGLPEADIPRDRIQDPMHLRSGGTDPGRDGCRVPLPWSAQAPYAGFGSTTEPWLPQPADWSSYAADRQRTDPDSMLSLYREALRLRRTEPGFRAAGAGGRRLTWLPSAPGVLAFTRTGGPTCVVNLREEPVELPEHTDTLLLSGPLDEQGRLPQDTAAWLRPHGRPAGQAAG